MNSTHTPGPFVVRPTSRPGNGSEWRDIVSVGVPFYPCYVGEALARDADLFAAAPDMLAALDGCVEVMVRVVGETIPIWKGTYCEETDWVAALLRARAAIAKAKGGRS